MEDSKKPLVRVLVILATMAIAAGLAWAGSDGSVSAGPISAFALCGIVSFGVNAIGFVHSW